MPYCSQAFFRVGRFESAAKDIWTVALNSSPIGLGHAALVKLPIEKESDGLSAKQISVGLLAKHSFDLRGKLGSLLAEKFDFTGVLVFARHTALHLGKLQRLIQFSMIKIWQLSKPLAI